MSSWWNPEWQPTVTVLDKTHQLQTELWRRRVADARSRHRSAVADLTRVIESNADVDGPPRPDAWKTVLEARFHESDALSVYIEALKAYSALSLGVASPEKARTGQV